MGPANFIEVLSKMRWASHQRAALNMAITDYIDLEPYVAIKEDDPEAQEYRFIARLRHPPPATISHVFSDFLNNMQGVLDYLAWQLARREGGFPDHMTHFPIEGPNEDGSEVVVNIYRAPDKGRGRIPMIADPKVLDLLHGVQPYQNGPEHWRTHPLQVLRMLNRESKHRHLPVLSSAGLTSPIYIAGRTIALGEARRVNDGDEVTAFTYDTVGDSKLPDQIPLTTYVGLEAFPDYPRTGGPLELTQIALSTETFIRGKVVKPSAKLTWA